jgi:hypothetical protein
MQAIHAGTVYLSMTVHEGQRAYDYWKSKSLNWFINWDINIKPSWVKLLGNPDTMVGL